jgi:hypothetical protein
MMTPAQVLSLIPEWSRCRVWLLEALKLCDGSHSEEDVLAGLLQSHYQLWPGKNSAIVTEVNVTPRLKAVNFWLVAGDLDEVKSMEAPILEWARSIGCTKALASGRRGWERALPHWAVKSVTIGRDI